MEGGSECPDHHPWWHQNFISNPSEGALGCWLLGPRPPRGVHILKDFICRKREEATVSRGDQGEVTGPGCRGRIFLQSLVQRVVSATERRGTLACPGRGGSLQSWLGGLGPGRASTPRRPQGHEQGFSQSMALRWDLGQALGKGAPGPEQRCHGSLVPFSPRFSGVSGGRQRRSSGPSSPSRASGQGAGGQ